ncbi:DUF6441 family protein [Thauera propionica]|uniref:DUF6441 family protein n=1 Tax=Thauera propionica TaxID=2019431 RepID=UPI0023F196A7|nr:DUF6441 family protein [Thauera propionica]MDD3676792.1 DUF6441 family protein [Thauera propionica]
MLKLDVTADVAKATAHLSQTARKRVPSAVAKALTRTAYDARDAVRAVMPRRFTIRRPWVVQGVGVTPANPRTLSAEVWSRDRFMALQEAGGVKTGKLAIPVGRMAAKAKTQVIPKSQWPRAMLAKKGVFVRRGTVFERKGKAIQALYLLRRQQKVEPRFGMADAVRSVALREYRRQMERALREELTKG